MTTSVPDDIHNLAGIAELEAALVTVEMKLDATFATAGHEASTSKEGAGLILEQVLDLIYDTFGSVIPYDRIGLAIVEDDGEVLRSRWARSEANSLTMGSGHRIISRASVSFMRSMVTFLMITSRPPTAETTFLVFTPAVDNKPLMVSVTIPVSTTSPSTMASSTTEAKATLVRTGSPLLWSITTTLISPLPTSSPTVVRFRPKSAISARFLLGIRRVYATTHPNICQAPKVLEVNTTTYCLYATYAVCHPPFSTGSTHLEPGAPPPSEHPPGPNGSRRKPDEWRRA